MTFLGRIRNKIKRWFLIARGAQIGKHAQIYYSVEITHAKGLNIGENSIIYRACTVFLNSGGRFSIGNHSHIAPYGYFLIQDQMLNVGHNVAIAPFCSFFCISNGTQPYALFKDQYEKGDIQIGNNVFIGAQCVILPGTTIGDNVVVAANSVVKGHLNSGFLYAGSPAKPVKKIE